MKEKAVTATLGIVLIVSVAINVYLLWLVSETKGQVAVFSDQVIITDEKIAELNNQLSEYEDWKVLVAQLAKDLEDSEKQVATLQDSLSESNLQIESLEAALEESTATIEELENQQPIRTPAPEVQTPAPQQQPVNPPAGLGNTPTFSGVPTGTGDGSGAIGSFGNYE